MDNTEGGVAYLRQVVLEDSLGIGEELEQEMARIVDSYQCSGRPPSTIRSVWRCSAPSLIATSPTRLCSAAICAVSRSRC